MKNRQPLTSPYMTSTLISPSTLTSLNSPTIRQLPNGLTIIAEQMPVAAVNLSLWLKVGSAVETDQINGMAHFLEHMVFKGTEKLPSGEFERLIEERGAVTNAATSQDCTHFYITTAPGDFAELAPLQIEVVLNPSIPEAAFDRERKVVLEEIRRSEDNPHSRSYQRSMEMAFERLPYRRSVLGPMAAIEQLTAQQMRDFHSNWYQPPSITAVAVGNLPVAELIEIVARGFTEAIGPTDAETFVEKYLHLNPEPAFTEIIRREEVDRSLTQAQLIVVWRVPGGMQLHQTYALDILASILGQGRTGRLIRDLREERGLVSSIFASNMTYEGQGVFYIAARLPEENLATVEAAIQSHISTIGDTIQEAEIARVRTLVANRFIFANETPGDRASLYGYYQSMIGDLAPALNYPARIQAIDAQELQAAAKRYLSPEAYGVLTIKPGTKN